MEFNYYTVKKSNDVKFLNCGIHKVSKGYYWGPFIRDQHLIHYVVNGKGVYEINDRSYNLESNQIFYIPPEYTTFYKADDELPWTYKWVGIKGPQADSLIELCGLSFENPIATIKNGEEVEERLDDIFNETKKDTISQCKLLALIYLFYDAISKNNDIINNKKSDEIYVERALAYIKHNFYRKITVNEIARTMNLNRSYLFSIFKKNTGMSIQEYILDVKIKNAKKYLNTTDNSIHTIANSIGYDDPLQFSRLFKNKVGISPREFRKNNISRH